MLGFDVELEAGDWPRGGRGREGSSGACSLVLEGEETTSPMSASKPNPRDASPSQRRGKRIKGGETPPKSSIGHSCAHIFSETSFARPLATRLVVEPTRARAQNNRLRAFASRRVHLSSRARLVSKRSPPRFLFRQKPLSSSTQICAREEEKTKAKKRCILSRVGRSLGTRRRVTRTKKRRGRGRVERTGTRSAGKEERSSRGDGRGHVFFLLRFVACASRCVKSLFFSFEGKRKSEATTKKGFKVSSISHPKHGRGDSIRRGDFVLSRFLHKATPSKDPEWPRERERRRRRRRRRKRERKRSRAPRLFLLRTKRLWIARTFFLLLLCAFLVMSSASATNQNALFFGLAGLAGVVKKTILSGFASPSAHSLLKQTHEEPPEHLKCVITQDLFEDPVVLLQTGYTYEREAISRWLRSKRFGNQPTDPTTNAIVTCMDVVPNWQIRAGVEAWLQEKGYSASEYFQKRMCNDANQEEEEEEEEGEEEGGKNADGQTSKKKKKNKYTTTLPPPKWPLVRCASGAPPATGEPTDKYGVPVGGRDGRGMRNDSSSSRTDMSRLAALAERMHNVLHRDVIVIFHALKRIALSSPRNLSIFLASFGAAVGGILVAFLIVVQRIMFLLTGRVSAAGLEPSAVLTSASSDEQVRAYINENAANSVATAIGNILWWTFILTMMWFTQHNALYEHQQAHLMRARAAQAQAEGNQRRQVHRYWHWGQRHPRFLHW